MDFIKIAAYYIDYLNNLFNIGNISMQFYNVFNIHIKLIIKLLALSE